jgi:hypothetical protein
MPKINYGLYIDGFNQKNKKQRETNTTRGRGTI